MGRMFLVIATVFPALFLGGCIFPAAAPSGTAVEFGAQASFQYHLVPLTKETADILATEEPEGFGNAFRDRKPPTAIKFGVGDSVNVTIFESASGGLFVPIEAGVRPGNFVSLPEQVVDNSGNITVPYAGVVRAAGRTNVEVQREIVKKISNRAIEPQAIVTLAQQRTNLVSVIGEVNAPARFPVAPAGAGDRIMDALTRAGGIKSQGYETWVILERDKRRATIPFVNLVSYPSNNIYLQPGDQIYVFRDPQRFVAFGATGEQGDFPFDAWRLSLAEAVGKAHGLLDTQADPGSVFLLRRLPRKIAAALGADLAQFPTEPLIPVVFRISFQDPSGYFLATQVLMRNQDLIFIANAQSVEVTKFLQLVNLAVSAGSNGGIGAWYISHVGM